MKKCKICGAYLGASISTGHHDNWACKEWFNFYLEKGINYMISKLDMREDNFCGVKQHDLSFQNKIINCASIWLTKNDYEPEKKLLIDYFKNKEKIINFVIKNNKDVFNEYSYVVDCNVIVDFYYNHNLENKQFKIIKINNSNERLEAKYFWCIEVDGEYFTVLSK